MFIINTPPAIEFYCKFMTPTVYDTFVLNHRLTYTCAPETVKLPPIPRLRVQERFNEWRINTVSGERAVPAAIPRNSEIPFSVCAGYLRAAVGARAADYKKRRPIEQTPCPNGNKREQRHKINTVHVNWNNTCCKHIQCNNNDSQIKRSQSINLHIIPIIRIYQVHCPMLHTSPGYGTSSPDNRKHLYLQSRRHPQLLY